MTRLSVQMKCLVHADIVARSRCVTNGVCRTFLHAKDEKRSDWMYNVLRFNVEWAVLSQLRN